MVNNQDLREMQEKQGDRKKVFIPNRLHGGEAMGESRLTESSKLGAWAGDDFSHHNTEHGGKFLLEYRVEFRTALGC